MTRKARSTRRKLLMSCVVNLGLFALVVVVLELGASLYVTRPGDQFQDDVRLNHPRRPHAYHLNRDFASQPEFNEPFEQVANAQGWLRRSDVSKVKPPGTYRVFYCGDSFVEGTAPMDAAVPQ